MENAMGAIATRVLYKWADEQKAKLHPRIKNLIAMAKWCLHYGPNMEGQDAEEDSEDGTKVVWPGWEASLKEIKDATEDLIQDVWVDIDCEEVMTTEPQGYSEDSPDYDPEYDVEEDDPEYEKVRAEEKVWVEPNWESISLVDARQVKHALLGELAEYV
jgi:hypothetical protein